MKWILVLSIFSSLPAQAYKEYNALSRTCKELQDIVKKDKIALMGGGRFTVHKKYCESTDKAVDNAYIASRDSDLCRPGILCRIKFPSE